MLTTKKILLGLCLVLQAGFLSAQCPDENEIRLDGQAEVDAFLEAYGDCTHLFELELSGDISDISGFSSLTSLDYLYINECPLITDLDGFSNVDSIFGNLGFYDTEGLTTLCGL